MVSKVVRTEMAPWLVVHVLVEHHQRYGVPPAIPVQCRLGNRNSVSGFVLWCSEPDPGIKVGHVSPEHYRANPDLGTQRKKLDWQLHRASGCHKRSPNNSNC